MTTVASSWRCASCSDVYTPKNFHFPLESWNHFSGRCYLSPQCHKGGGPVNRLQRAVACIGEFSLYFWNFSLDNTIDQNLTDHARLQPDHSQSLLFRLQEERLLCMTFRTILPLLLSLPSAHPISTLQTPFPPSSFHSSSCFSPFLYSQSRISCCSIPTLFPFSKHSATRGIRLIW